MNPFGVATATRKPVRTDDATEETPDTGVSVRFHIRSRGEFHHSLHPNREAALEAIVKELLERQFKVDKVEWCMILDADGRPVFKAGK